ncbi:MAG: hypothetical protein DWQ36_03595 [Acidobacteria bacterium]|nr:MAG: hypothetical protein DWQ30_16310 [Acidobacteriota bacterium]REK10618.1 MAG: hypothetical protein DWQ36_03595 [Acidobacteriota bacterium]
MRTKREDTRSRRERRRSCDADGSFERLASTVGAAADAGAGRRTDRPASRVPSKARPGDRGARAGAAEGPTWQDREMNTAISCSSPSSRRLAAFALAICLAIAAGPAGAQETRLLLDARRAPAVATEAPYALQAFQVDVDTAALDAAPELLRIELPQAPGITIARTDTERRGAGDLVWRGFVEGSEHRVTLTLKNGFAVGRIESPHGLYELSPRAGLGTVLLRLDPDGFPECSGEVEPLAPADAAGPEPESVALGRDAAPPRGSRGTVNIDLLSVYSPTVLGVVGTVPAMEATAQAAVDVANTAHIDSDMVARFTLVHTALTDFDESGSSLSLDLSAVASNAAVASLRDQYGADMVGMIVSAGGCGIGFVMRNPGPGFASSAFQVSGLSCAVGNLTYAHEHGHNMGYEHDPANSTTTPAGASFSWSFGHFHNGSYRTVMSYSNQCVGGCNRVAHFSNPDVLHNGLATGIAGQRDNARTGDDTAAIVAAFRAPATDIFEDGFETGDTSSWSSTTP